MARPLMAVSVGPEDDLDELARRHLGSPSRKWIIKDFNQIEDVTEGQLDIYTRDALNRKCPTEK